MKKLQEMGKSVRYIASFVNTELSLDYCPSTVQYALRNEHASGRMGRQVELPEEVERNICYNICVMQVSIPYLSECRLHPFIF